MTLIEEYNLLSTMTYTPAVEERMDEILGEIHIKLVAPRRQRLPYRGSYWDMLADQCREYPLTQSDERRLTQEGKPKIG